MIVKIALALAFVAVLAVEFVLMAHVAFAQRPTPHTLDGRGDCLACHGAGMVKPAPADHAGRTNQTCVACHQPAAGAAPSQPTQAAPSPTVTAPAATPTATSAPSGATTASTPAATTTPEPTRTPTPAPTPRAAPTDSAGCLACHQEQTLAVRLNNGEILPANVPPDQFGKSVHGSKLPCVACHPDKTTVPHQPLTAQDRVQYTIARIQVCATCHQQVTATYWDSVHGKLVAAGRADAPTCVTCHSKEANAHTLQNNTAADSPTSDRNVASQVCGQCHTEAYQSYDSTFHGKAMRLGVRADAATCVDCHGAYGVQRVHGAEKQVDNVKLGQVCAQCHPGADESFASGWPGHEKPSPSWFPAAFFTERFLYFLTVGVVGFGIVHVELDTLRWLVNRRRRRGPEDGQEQKEANDGKK